MRDDDVETLREAIEEAAFVQGQEYAVGAADHRAVERERRERLAALERLSRRAT